MSDDSAVSERWSARPVQAVLIRAVSLLTPIVASLAFVNLASRMIHPPTESFWLYMAWWVLLSGAATVVLILVDRLSRRLLPLAALFKLSLVFPDRAPSRFRTALGTGTVKTLQERIANPEADVADRTPAEAAQRLLQLVAMLDTHDRLTRGHSERVRAYAHMIGEELRLGKREIDLLNWAALLHDIGKLNVPAAILAKDGRPTGEEWEILRRHPEFGRELVAPLRDWLGEWSEAVAQHHERWDGLGYPNGVKGEEIALAGRIVAVADVFDVITSARSYKRAAAAVAGRAEIARCAGNQFDPRVARAFLGISLGRLRFAMGPLSWLAHAPILGRLPLTPAIGTLSSSVAAVTAALSTGLVAQPPAAPAQRPIQSVDAPSLARAVDEDNRLVVQLPGISSVEDVSSLRLVGPPGAGIANTTPGHAIQYTPPPDYHGITSLRYEACWKDGHCSQASVRILIRPVNDPPVAVDDVVTAKEDAPIWVNVLTNDSDVDGDRLSVAAIRGLTTGSTRRSGGRVHLLLPENFNGKATFVYTVRDGHGGSASARVTVFVSPRNDPPVARPDFARTAVGIGVRIPVLANDSDPDGDPVWVLDATDPNVGTVANDGTAVTYTPPSAFRGAAHFTYTLSDPSRAHARGRVDIAVGNVNLRPVANDDALSVVQDTSALIDVLANDHDPEGGVLSIVSVGTPARGTLARIGSRIRYTAPARFKGTVSFPYTVSDPAGATATATVTIDVGEAEPAPSPPAPNEPAPNKPKPPAPTPPPAPAPPPTPPAPAPAPPVPAPPAPAPSPPAPPSPSPPSPPANSPPSFTAGPDETVLEDAGAQSVAGWATAISPGPSADSGQTVSFIVTNSNNSLFTVGGQPTVAPDGTLTFTPAANRNGSATVTVRAVDNGGTANGGNDTSPPASFTIAVTPQQDSPIAVDDAVSVNEDDTSGVTFQVLANDSDPDGDTVSLTSFDGSTITVGTLTDNGGGSFTYVPDADFYGSETFSYIAGDGNGGSDNATVAITVIAQPDSPVGADDAYTTPQDTPLVLSSPGVLGNDGDADGDTLTVSTTPVVAPTNGSLALSADGSFTYTPNSGFVGTDSFTYRVDDGTGLTDDALASITVNSSLSNSLLYLDSTGPSADVWDITTAAPPASALVPDYDSDGTPGLTINTSSGAETVTAPDKYQVWSYTLPGPLQLNGPVTLQLWSTLALITLNRDGHPYVYLYDCTPGGAADPNWPGCVKIAENNVQVTDWNSLLPSWVYHEITIGSVTRSIPAGNELRVRLLFKPHDLWVAMTAAYPSALLITTG